MTRTTISLAAITAVFCIVAFFCVLVIHSILLLIRLSLIAALACFIIGISRAFTGRAGGRQGARR